MALLDRDMHALLKRLVIVSAAQWPLRRLICWRAAKRTPQIALTFDDGPHPSFTPQVLDLLASHGTKATFFVLGKEVEKHPAILKRTLAEGHEIGIHGYDHTDRDLPRQMERTIDIVTSLGARPNAIRPPGGQLSWRILRWSALARRPLCLWSFDLEDSRRYEGKSSKRRSLKELSRGDIVLLHDDNPVCVAELPGLIALAHNRRFNVVCVSELLNA